MNRRIDIIQLLRGIAALLVCFFHMKALLNTSAMRYGTMLFGSGSIGVQIFFIISGFIMVYTTRKSDGTPHYVKNFLIKRLIRVVPLYYIMVLFWLVVYERSLSFFVEEPLTILKTFCFIPLFNSPLGPAYGMPPLKVGWSLNYEVLFYIIFGLSLFLKRYRWTMLLVVFTTLVVFIPLIFKGYVNFIPSVNYDFKLSYFLLLTNPILIFFIVGVLLGLIYNSSFIIKSKVLQIVLVLISLVYFFLLYFRVSLFLNGFFISMFSSTFLVFSLLLFNKGIGIRVPSFLVYLGDMSYSLYLVHPIVIIGLPSLLVFLKMGGVFNGKYYFLICTACILLLSVISYELIEKRLLKRAAIYLTSSDQKKIEVSLQPELIEK
ncbi:MAG: acyltransferase [Bacteroidetes bacterium]|nr:acyltransferase [Bacteroidota bacterium]